MLNIYFVLVSKEGPGLGLVQNCGKPTESDLEKLIVGGGISAAS